MSRFTSIRSPIRMAKSSTSARGQDHASTTAPGKPRVEKQEENAISSEVSWRPERRFLRTSCSKLMMKAAAADIAGQSITTFVTRMLSTAMQSATSRQSGSGAHSGG